ncbi:putative ABC transport system permease protein [Chitinophaga terrae (ex Kim and Jung 2007)]|jgi:putative ABC transport system permease protein|uniref:Putative ABC transport system permease protein n=1 Tax=Chitinophaga terrae (ex Kim and Jung 2007) TaxID=408074 RepID=A0A1H4EQL0_9BACT|nr:ABC transporter permease [Chitinophaga terrae (ex Kim and Jung 2007)]MDQ0107626.1 putative ABC transport system permease protein [Chitinophaga terrae (ex Kim and Jung 2007)]GEP91776.1 ABC transporter permease [Chitinophaga terrae (ex Kim and Jung 2007)]SEA86810.1 putative ABC transport system permease protein [Chitinophaga terrae (ex Kim and Jung 2007)]
MISTLKILWNSFKMAMQELRVNKLRTFLSLFGITIGIFCIIGVLTLTGSLEYNIRKDLADLGDDVIYVQKWPWGGGGEYPWWKYMNRPEPEYKELKIIQDKVHSASFASFNFESGGKKVEYGNDYMDGVNMMAVTHDFSQIQTLQIADGRYFAASESNNGANVAILGYSIWDGLFSSPEAALGKIVKVLGRDVKVIGVLKKKGESMIGGIGYDNAIIMPYKFARTIVDERKNGDPYILVKANSKASLEQLKDELRAVMRAQHRLKPTEEDDFALNEISSANDSLNTMFATINLTGGFIAFFSLLVGSFGIANIMFVTVKERTNIIGLKKAIGAKRQVILMEFLLESVSLSLFGGIIGMLLIYILTIVIGAVSTFEMVLSPGTILFGLSVSIGVGMLAGFIPAYLASRLDPVVAIRSN